MPNFIIPSEIFPLNVRGSAMGVCLLINWRYDFLIAFTFLSVFEAAGRPAPC